MELDDPRVDAVLDVAARLVESTGHPSGPRAVLSLLRGQIDAMEAGLIPYDTDKAEAIYLACARLITRVPRASILN